MALSAVQRVRDSCPIGAGEGSLDDAVSTRQRCLPLASEINRRFEQHRVSWMVFRHRLVFNLLERIICEVEVGLRNACDDTNAFKRQKLSNQPWPFLYNSGWEADALTCFEMRSAVLFGKVPISETSLRKKTQGWHNIKNCMRFLVAIASKVGLACTNMSKSDTRDPLNLFDSLEGLTENKDGKSISEVLRDPNILAGDAEKTSGHPEHFIKLIKLSTSTDRCEQEPPLCLDTLVTSTWKEGPARALQQTKTTDSNLVPTRKFSTDITSSDWHMPKEVTHCCSKIEIETRKLVSKRRLAAIYKDLQACVLEDVFEWDALPQELQQKVLEGMPFEMIFRLRPVSKAFYGLPQLETFQQAQRLTRANEGSLSSMFVVIQKGKLQISGFDLVSQKWRRLPPLTCLPSPDPELFKDYLIAGGGGLFCAEVSKDRNVEKLLVINPLTQSSKELPPLTFRRHPVLMYVLARSETNSYKVIVAGSSGMDSPELSRKTEVYDSLTQKWEVIGDIPGEDFALNEYQTGAYSDGQLHCVAFVGNGTRKGVLACDVERGIWHQDPTCFLPCSSCQRLGNNFTIAQLVETIKGVYLFTEREEGQVATQFLHKLEYIKPEGWKWTEVMSVQKNYGRALLVYPEYTCLPHGIGKFCIFNTIEHTGIVYDIENNTHELLPLPPLISNVESFHCLNPLSYTFQPNFTTSI